MKITVPAPPVELPPPIKLIGFKEHSAVNETAMRRRRYWESLSSEEKALKLHLHPDPAAAAVALNLHRSA